MGIDQLPEQIRFSKVLSGNHLGMLGNVEDVPDENSIIEYREEERVSDILNQFYNQPDELRNALHVEAARLLDEGKVSEAWLTLMQE